MTCPLCREEFHSISYGRREYVYREPKVETTTFSRMLVQPIYFSWNCLFYWNALLSPPTPLQMVHSEIETSNLWESFYLLKLNLKEKLAEIKTMIFKFLSSSYLIQNLCNVLLSPSSREFSEMFEIVSRFLFLIIIQNKSYKEVKFKCSFIIFLLIESYLSIFAV